MTSKPCEQTTGRIEIAAETEGGRDGEKKADKQIHTERGQRGREIDFYIKLQRYLIHAPGSRHK